MFEIPDAKRVRREELTDSDEGFLSEIEEDKELEARLNAQIAKSLGLDEASYSHQHKQATTVASASAKHSSPDDALDSGSGSEPKTPVNEEIAGHDGETTEDDGFLFRLFSTTGPAPKVLLEDETKLVEGKLVRGRPLSYYIAADVSPDQKKQYAFAAVTGEDVVVRSTLRAWGLEMPWRVKNIKVTRVLKPGERVRRDGEDEQLSKRKRPGKKRRVVARQKLRAKAKKEEEAKQKILDKEEQLQDKKKRMNRLKKLRKRAKNKEKKQQVGEVGGDDGSSAEEK